MHESGPRYALFTSSDANCGDFLVNHWARSLLENVDLSHIQVIVLDYGLTDEQRGSLESKGLICRRCVRERAHLHILRHREIAMVLREGEYDQVGIVDGGDVVFQADFSHVFEQDQHAFRAVCEDTDGALHEFIMKGSDFAPETWKTITNCLRGRPCINCSSVFAPAAKYLHLWNCFQAWCTSYDEFGTDQAVVNYLLHNEGFVQLPWKYNFIPGSTKQRYSIRDGQFYDQNGELIPIVHNAGGTEFWRCIKNFGYGKDRNQKKILAPFLMRTVVAPARWCHRTLRGRRGNQAPVERNMKTADS